MTDKEDEEDKEYKGDSAPTLLRAYPCSFCQDESIAGCFACGKRYCREHGEYPIPARCQECQSLEQIGDTYRFRLKDGSIIEDLSFVKDDELRTLLQMYANKVKELETLMAGAKRQQTVLRRRLGLLPKTEESSGGTIAVSVKGVKAKKPPTKALGIGEEALKALADLLMKDPEMAKKMLQQKPEKGS